MVAVNNNYRGAIQDAIAPVTAINPMLAPYNAVGDVFTDDDYAIRTALADCIAQGRALYIPPTPQYGGFRITGSTLEITGDVLIFGAKGSGGFKGESLLTFTTVDADWFKAVEDANVYGFRDLMLKPFAGVGGQVTAVTSTTITFDRLVPPPRLTTIAAVVLAASFTPITLYAYYTNSGQVYRALTAGTAGATLPTHTSGTVTTGGISWEWINAGTTYQIYGDFGWGAHFYITGYVDETITVVPAPGNIYGTPDVMVSTLGGIDQVSPTGRGYFTSQEEHSTTTRTSAAINCDIGNDCNIEGVWFSTLPFRAVTRGTAFQGGEWTGNRVDGAQAGFVGDFTNCRIYENLFYGCQKGAGIDITSAGTSGEAVGGNAMIHDNTFHANIIGLRAVDTGYVGGVVGNLISGLKLSGNYYKLNGTGVDLTGVPHLDMRNETLYRSQQHAIKLKYVGVSTIDATVWGWGETALTSGAKYNALLGDIGTTSNTITLRLGYINSSQNSTEAIKFAAGQEAYANLNFWNIPATILPASTTVLASNLSTVNYGDDGYRMNGRVRNSFLLYIKNNAGTLQHAFHQSVKSLTLPKLCTHITGASATFANTPSVTAAVPFVNGLGINNAQNSDLLFDSSEIPIAEMNSDSPGMEIQKVTTGTYRFSIDTTSSDVNGVTRERLTIRCHNGTTGSAVNIATALGTAGDEFRLRINVYL